VRRCTCSRCGSWRAATGAPWGWPCRSFFAGGVDAHNIADLVALDLAPVTVCTDWLKTGGYSRGARMFETLLARMDAVGARDREGLRAQRVRRSPGRARRAGPDGRGRDAGPHRARLRHGPHRPRPRALRALGTRHGAAQHRPLRRRRRGRPAVPTRPRRASAQEGRHTPRALRLPHLRQVHPGLPQRRELRHRRAAPGGPVLKAERVEGRWHTRREGTVHVGRAAPDRPLRRRVQRLRQLRHRLPRGGAHRTSPSRGFTGRWRPSGPTPTAPAWCSRDSPTGTSPTRASCAARPSCCAWPGRARYEGPGFSLRFDFGAVETSLEGEADAAVDLTPAHIVHTLASAVLSPREVNPVSTLS
jgi:hypothetical protein